MVAYEKFSPYESVACIKYSWFLVAMHAVNVKTEWIGNQCSDNTSSLLLIVLEMTMLLKFDICYWHNLRLSYFFKLFHYDHY